MINYRIIKIYVLMGLISLFLSLLSINQIQNSIRESNIFENINYDFIVFKPSIEQVEEINKLEFIKKAVPFYAITDNVEVNGMQKNYRVVIFENFDDIEFTNNNSNRLQMNFEKPISKDSAFIDFHVFESSSLSLDETFILDFGIEQQLNVKSIYNYDNSSNLNIGTITIQINDAIRKYIVDRNYVYAGAFISSSSYTDTINYLRNYKPLGELEQKKNIDEEAFKRFSESFMASDHSEAIIIASNKTFNYFLMSLVYTLILGSLLILVSFFTFVSKISYDSKNIRKNLENGSLPEVLSFQKNKYKIIIIVNFLIIVGYLAIFVLLKSYTNIKIIILLSHYLLWIAFTISIIYNDLFAHLLLKQQIRKTIVKWYLSCVHWGNNMVYLSRYLLSHKLKFFSIIVFFSIPILVLYLILGRISTLERFYYVNNKTPFTFLYESDKLGSKIYIFQRYSKNLFRINGSQFNALHLNVSSINDLDLISNSIDCSCEVFTDKSVIISRDFAIENNIKIGDLIEKISINEEYFFVQGFVNSSIIYNFSEQTSINVTPIFISTFNSLNEQMTPIVMGDSKLELPILFSKDQTSLNLIIRILLMSFLSTAFGVFLLISFKIVTSRMYRFDDYLDYKINNGDPLRKHYFNLLYLFTVLTVMFYGSFFGFDAILLPFVNLSIIYLLSQIFNYSNGGVANVL